MTTFEDLAPIHVSDLLAFKTCRRRWAWSSPLGNGLAPLRTPDAFFIGRAVHYALEHLHREGQDPAVSLGEFLRAEMPARLQAARAEHPRQLWPLERQALREAVRLTRVMLEHYVLWARRYNGPFNDREIEFLSHERVFRVPLRDASYDAHPGAFFEGRIDGIVRRRTDGSIWLWEIKTCRSIPQRVSLLALDEQATAYCIAAEELLGEPVAGVVYNLMRKREPATPAVLKNGMLSQNKSIDTSFDWYLRAIRQHHGSDATPGFIANNYAGMLQELQEREEPQAKGAYFARVAVRRTPEHLRRYRNDMYAVASEMISPLTVVYRTPGWHCHWCPFRQPCMAHYEGDYQSMDVLLSEFVRRDFSKEYPLEEEQEE